MKLLRVTNGYGNEFIRSVGCALDDAPTRGFGTKPHNMQRQVLAFWVSQSGEMALVSVEWNAIEIASIVYASCRTSTNS